MKTSEPCSDLIAALAKARLAFPAIVRNQSAIARGGREYHYADLSTIADATSGVLAQHGLVLVQAVEDGETGQLCISSTLYHTSGQWLQEALSVPRPASMQEIGSVSTYLRRYQQSALLNLATEDDDDAASTPGATTEPVARNGNGGPSEPAPAAADAGPTRAPQTGRERPTDAQIAALQHLALTTCKEDQEVYEQRIRTTMGLKPSASVSPKLLTRTMTLAQYQELFQYYMRLHAQLTRKTPETSADEPTAATTASAEPAQPAPEETSAAVPSGASSSASDPESDATERDRQRLRQEAAAWGLTANPDEIERVILRYPYSRARTILWQYRRPNPAQTLIASAAD